MLKKHFNTTLAAPIFIVVLLTAFPAFSDTAFGPKQYTRTAGAPCPCRDTFNAFGGTGNLIIENGNTGGDHHITSAEIYLNGIKILGSHDFKRVVHQMEKTVPLRNGSNTLNVVVRGKPGSYITAFVTVPSPITLNITSPSDGGIILKPDILVEGTFVNASGRETGVVVNGVASSISGGNFVSNHIPLAEGQNTITATATDENGSSASVSIKVNAETAGNYIQLSAIPDSGLPLFQTTLNVGGSFGFTESTIIHTGPDQVEILENTNINEHTAKMTTPGIYYFTGKVSNASDQIYTDTIAVQVFDGAELDTLLRAKWMGMRQALVQNDIPTAASFFIESKKNAYREIFTALSSKLPQISHALDDIQLIKITYNSAEYDIRTTHNGHIYSYPLRFVKDTDGLWKIKSF